MNLYSTVNGLVRLPADDARFRIGLVGAARIPAGGSVVLAANHESILDPLFLGTVTQRPIRYPTRPTS